MKYIFNLSNLYTLVLLFVMLTLSDALELSAVQAIVIIAVAETAGQTVITFIERRKVSKTAEKALAEKYRD